MSVIVAVRGANRVCMACDSQATNGSHQCTLAAGSRKIVKRGAMVFGPCGLVTIDALRHHLPESAFTRVAPGELRDWCATVLVVWLRDYFKGRDLLDNAEHGAKEFPHHSLVACGAELVVVDCQTGVFSVDDSAFAVGSGRDFALGAAWQALADADGDEWMHDHRAADAAVIEHAATRGVLAAVALDPGCGPPVVVQ